MAERRHKRSLAAPYEIEGVYEYTEAEHEEVMKLRALYVVVNKMMAALGKSGELQARSESVTKVMDALHAIDGGTYNPRIGGCNVD